MPDPFLGEIKMVGFNFPPRNWALCNGQNMAITQNAALYTLLGSQFGGDDRVNFSLPDMRGRVPMHMGINRDSSSGHDYTQGEKGGLENVVLTVSELPEHAHSMMASTEYATFSNPGPNKDGILATEQDEDFYSNPTNLTEMNSGTTTNAGSGQAHYNIQPYQTINFVIALQGLYPSRN